MYEMYLAHHGILGMKWGLRRYQNKDGSLTPAGKTRYSGQSNPRHKPSSARKAAKQRAAALEKARKAKAEKKVYEEARKKALESGNATEVLKYRKGSTQAELDAALRRINTERSLAEISAKEMAKGKSTVDKIIDTADTWRARGEKAINVWNLVAKVHNSFVDEDDAWQKIGEKSVKEQKIERHKAEQEKLKKESREKMLADYAKQYGDYNEVVKYIDKMSKKDAEAALKRFMPGDDQESKERSKLVAEYIVNYGSNKKVEAYLPEMSTDELKTLLARKKKESDDSDKEKEKEK